MKAKENKIKYIKEYNKRNIQYILLSFNKEKDKEMLEELNEAQSKTEKVREWYRKAKGQ